MADRPMVRMLQDEEDTAGLFVDDARLDADRLSDRVTDRLRVLIMTLELEPGATLSEGAISQRLGCGRTPLREAILRLAEERLIVVLPRRAVAVAPITVSDLTQIYEARLAMETMSARLAAERITAEQLAALGDLVPDPATVAGLRSPQVLDLDFSFHLRLARAARNDYLADSIRRLLGPAMRLTFLADQHGVPIRPMLEEHRELLEALRTRRPDEAARAMRTHILQAKDRTLGRI